MPDLSFKSFPKPVKKKRAKRKAPDRRAVLVKECDRLWSEIVLKSDTHCSWCGRPHNVYQAHHIFSRSRLPTRWVIINGIKLGQGCHRKAHQECAMDFADFIRERLGEQKYQFLKLKKAGMMKKSIFNLELVKEQLLEIKAQTRG